MNQMIATGIAGTAGGNQIDTRVFRRCLGHFATGVTVVSAMSDDLPVGMTANSFSSVSIDPPLILWSINKTAKSFPAMCSAENFAINILSADQISIANIFAKSGMDKFANVSWFPGETGSPLIEGAAARLECRQEALHQAGDHVIIVGRVVAFESFDRSPLVFAKGRYALTAEYQNAWPPEYFPLRLGDVADEPFIRLARNAADCISAAFEAHRAGEGINYNQAQVLTRVAARPGIGIDQVAGASLLALPHAQDAMAALVALGCLSTSPTMQLHLTPKGALLMDRLTDRARNFEASYLADFNADEVDAARRVLAALCDCAPQLSASSEGPTASGTP